MIQACLYGCSDLPNAVDYPVATHEIEILVNVPEVYTIAALINPIRHYEQSSTRNFLHDKLAKLHETVVLDITSAVEYLWSRVGGCSLQHGNEGSSSNAHMTTRSP